MRILPAMAAAAAPAGSPTMTAAATPIQRAMAAGAGAPASPTATPAAMPIRSATAAGAAGAAPAIRTMTAAGLPIRRAAAAARITDRSGVEKGRDGGRLRRPFSFGPAPVHLRAKRAFSLPHSRKLGFPPDLRRLMG